MQRADANEHVDPFVLGEVRELIGERFCAMLARYLVDSFNLISRLTEAADRGRLGDLTECAQSLGASSRGVGAISLALLCHELTTCARQRRRVALARLLLEIHDEYRVVSGLLGEEIRLCDCGERTSPRAPGEVH